MPIHDVDVNPVGTGAVDGPNLFAKLGKIGRQDRRGDDDVSGDHVLGHGGLSNRPTCPVTLSRVDGLSRNLQLP
jgi:hypothetical protein